MLPIKIVYEDRDILVVNKPAGWVSTKERKGEKGPTVEEWLKPRVNKGLRRNGLVHRLDKGTSGLMVAAKNQESLEYLLAEFKERKVEKRYWALVEGEVVAEGQIEAPVGRKRGSWGKFGVVVGGKQARSRFVKMGEYQKRGRRYALVDVAIETGRTHQIRVHFSFLRWPVVGDRLYGGRAGELDRPFLHAYRLVFRHPRTSKKMKFEIDLPKDLKEALRGYEEV